MFNNSLFSEEAKLKMQEREREAESYRFQKQLGYSDYGVTRWIFVFVTLITALLILLF